VRLFPARAADLAAALAASLAAVPDGPSESDGVAYGDFVAAALVAARAADNILTPGPVYVPGTNPGDYQLTTTTPPQPVNTNAPNWLPFALQSASQFRPNGPARVASPEYARDYDETRRLGGEISAGRNADQDEIAQWHTEMAQFQFNRIARAEIDTDGRDLLDHARLFALLNVAMADAVTAVFESKYFFRFWRPVTAITNGDLDGNPRTDVDPGWRPFKPTPPHPEYPAAHGTVQGAGARILSSYFGPRHGFTTTSPTVPGITRSYSSFDAFADEGFMARIYGGMHFRSSLEDGARQGKKVGNWVLDHLLTALP
jgi:PAP2 superfamily